MKFVAESNCWVSDCGIKFRLTQCTKDINTIDVTHPGQPSYTVTYDLTTGFLAPEQTGHLEYLLYRFLIANFFTAFQGSLRLLFLALGRLTPVG